MQECDDLPVGECGGGGLKVQGRKGGGDHVCVYPGSRVCVYPGSRVCVYPGSRVHQG